MGSHEQPVAANPFDLVQVVTPDVYAHVNEACATLRVVSELDGMYSTEIGREAATRALADDPRDVLEQNPQNVLLLAAGKELSEYSRAARVQRFRPDRAFALGVLTAADTVQSLTESYLENDAIRDVAASIEARAHRLVETRAADYRPSERGSVLRLAFPLSVRPHKADALSEAIIAQMRQDADEMWPAEAAQRFADYLTREDSDAEHTAHSVASALLSSDLGSLAAARIGPQFTRTVMGHMASAEASSDILDSASPAEGYQHGVFGGLAFVALTASHLVDTE